MQATAGGVTPDEWVYLVGLDNSATDELGLYVDGTLEGTVPDSTPWDARRGLIVGATSHDGAPTDFFPGTIDDVQIYDKPLAQTEVTNLYHQQSIGSGRPARAIFPLDEPPTDDACAPTTQVTGRGEVNPAVLKGGATAGQPGVTVPGAEPQWSGRLCHYHTASE